MKCCINDVNFISLLLLSTELFKFEIQKYGQILCVHKPYFLMPGHIFKWRKVWTDIHHLIIIYIVSICIYFVFQIYFINVNLLGNR